MRDHRQSFDLEVLRCALKHICILQVIDRQGYLMGMPFDWHLPGVKQSALVGEAATLPQSPFTATSPLKQL